MRAIFAIQLLTLAALVGCDGRDLEGEVNALNAELRAKDERLQQAEQNAVAAQALVNELEARGIPISSFRVTVTVECNALPGREPGELRGAGTVIDLIRADGRRWRLNDAMDTPPRLEDLGSGTYAATFSYRPEPGSSQSLVGQDITALAQVGMIGLRLSSILSSLGLEMSPAGITRLSVEVNDMTVVDVGGLGLPSRPDRENFQSFDVSAHFSSLPATYFAGLRQRARSRSAY